jgi:hypothetical protein
VRIGIDFDNTIACYDGTFHAAAVERGLIPSQGVGIDKISVRDWLRGQGREADFTALQGYVYGPGMKHVECYPGILEFVQQARAARHEVFVISHKTVAPFAGPAYDLHQSARDFLRERQLVWAPDGLIAPESVFFELTKEEKTARAASLQLDVFIDDLPEILAMDGFPASTRAILFDPNGHYPDGAWQGRRFERYSEWQAIAETLLSPAA